MSSIPKTPLEAQISRKIGLAPNQTLNNCVLSTWQVQKLNETIHYACERSPFYRRIFDKLSKKTLSALEDLSQFPFTTAEDLRNDPMSFLCVSQNRIARVVTLQTSGTTHAPKRLFFSEDDLELTIDFFHQGMSTLTEPNQTVLILMPGATPASVGDLLVKGLSRMNVQGIVHGPVVDAESTINQIIEKNVDCLVGIPIQVLSLVRHQHAPKIGKKQIKTILLSTDYVPKAITIELQRVWGCKVFQHYGMTEMGYGGGVTCHAFDGYHLREADLYFEIVDPIDGRPVPDGFWGEIVFTTLTRRTMPLIRYRTGDRSRFIKTPCPCRSVLRRMASVSGRTADTVCLKNGTVLTIPLLDEAIFLISDVLDYQVKLDQMSPCCRLDLSVVVTDMHNHSAVLDKVREAVMKIPELQDAFQRNWLTISKLEITPNNRLRIGPAKRKILRIKENAKREPSNIPKNGRTNSSKNRIRYCDDCKP